MNRPDRVLFAISDTGGGHRSAAIAITAALQMADSREVSCEMLDVLRITNFPLVRNAPNLYDQLSTRWLPLYNLTFEVTNGIRRVDVLSRLVYLQARRNIARALQSFNPDLVVVTHPLVYRLVRAARRTHRLSYRIVTVVTDLVTLHASWTHPDVDICLLPTDEAYALMQRRGLSPNRMRRTGFPVHPKFAHYSQSRAESRQELGIDMDRFTVLMTSGGVGSGRMHDLVLELERVYPETQFLVITGKNRTLQQQLQARRRSPHCHIFGFVQNMETLMAASDIVVSKAGPGTLMESFVMRCPVIVTEAVGAQERGNIDFVLNHELGFYCPTTERIVDAISELNNPDYYQTTINRLAAAVPRHGAEQIAQILLEQLAQTDRPAEQRQRPRRTPLRHWRRALRRGTRQPPSSRTRP
jgi:UDP-N-acetylglucosamine:LPS N-acetylglucosamine transferase